MATFFGEVRLMSSRAYDEYEEEELREVYNVEVQFAPEKKCHSLIISYGALANDFIEGCIHNDYESKGAILIKKVNAEEKTDTGDFHPRVLKPSPLYVTSNGVLLCQASEDILPKLAGRIARNLLYLIESSAPVLVVSSHHASKLSSVSDLPYDYQCQTFCLQSPSLKPRITDFLPLPQPCVLDSLPAAVMTECIIEDRPCALYATFTETTSPGNIDLVSEDLTKAISQRPFTNSVHFDRKYVTKYNAIDVISQYM